MPFGLFVGGLAADAGEEDVWEAFTPFGELVRCDVKVGYAFVSFRDEYAARSAQVSLNGATFLGNRIAVHAISGSKAKDPRCFECGETGHQPRDCPHPYGAGRACESTSAEEETEEDQARHWVESVLGETLPLSLVNAFCSGELLCRMVNAFRPGMIQGVHTGGPTLERAHAAQNLERFVAASRALGVHENQIFNPIEFMDTGKTTALIHTILALRECVEHRDIPTKPKDGLARLRTTLRVELDRLLEAPPEGAGRRASSSFLWKGSAPPPTALLEWSEEDVRTWLSSCGLGHHRRAFRIHHVNGPMLANMDEEHLEKELDVTRPSEVRAIMKELEQLREQCKTMTLESQRGLIEDEFVPSAQEYRIRQEGRDAAVESARAIWQEREDATSARREHDAKAKARDLELLHHKESSEKLADVEAQSVAFRRLTAMKMGSFADNLEYLHSQFNSILSEVGTFVDMGREDVMTLSAIISTMMKNRVAMEEQYDAMLRERRYLFNAIQELKGNIRVFARVRPLLTSEGTEPAMSFPSEEEIAVQVKTAKGPTTRVFRFDRIFTGSATQTEIFEETEPLVTSVLDGYNVCIFAYGQTGSGKTHTMEGPGADRGIYFRALTELFTVAKKREDHMYALSMSMLEIRHNEDIRDLLSAEPGETPQIQHDKSGIFVSGVNVVDVSSPQEVHRLVADGVVIRARQANNNRSHSILTIRAIGENIFTGKRTDAKLHLCDLAGSERVAQSDAERPVQPVNKSLLALGDVIQALHQKSKHVPYRNSKLTHLLRDSLGGDSKVLMFVQLSPRAADAAESLSSLTFAAHVRSVELGHAKKNTETSDIIKLRMTIDKLQKDLEESRNKISSLQAKAKEQNQAVNVDAVEKARQETREAERAGKRFVDQLARKEKDMENLRERVHKETAAREEAMARLKEHERMETRDRVKAEQAEMLRDARAEEVRRLEAQVEKERQKSRDELGKRDTIIQQLRTQLTIQGADAIRDRRSVDLDARKPSVANARGRTRPFSTAVIVSGEKDSSSLLRDVSADPVPPPPSDKPVDASKALSNGDVDRKPDLPRPRRRARPLSTTTGDPKLDEQKPKRRIRPLSTTGEEQKPDTTNGAPRRRRRARPFSTSDVARDTKPDETTHAAGDHKPLGNVKDSAPPPPRRRVRPAVPRIGRSGVPQRSAGVRGAGRGRGKGGRGRGRGAVPTTTAKSGSDTDSTFSGSSTSRTCLTCVGRDEKEKKPPRKSSILGSGVLLGRWSRNKERRRQQEEQS